MNFLNLFLVIFLAYATNGLEYNGFRVKHAWSDALKDVNSFFDIPRTIADAELAGYHNVPRNVEQGMQVSMRCLDHDVRVCPLYDNAGTIAGLQIAIPVADLNGLPYDMSHKLVMKNILGADYWTTSHYIVSAETLNKGGRHGTIVETIEGIWVQSAKEHTLMRIPLNEAEFQHTLFKKQNCIPNMGTHYYYNVSAEMDCHSFFPYFALVKEGKTLGVGWQIVGHTHKRDRHWFESVPSKAVEITAPSAPECLKDWVKEYGVISLHIYYIEEPWTIKCEDIDSLEPMSTINKFLLTSSRYAGKVIDGAKKIFG